jgi:hypothetical protein
VGHAHGRRRRHPPPYVHACRNARASESNVHDVGTARPLGVVSGVPRARRSAGVSRAWRCSRFGLKKAEAVAAHTSGVLTHCH